MKMMKICIVTLDWGGWNTRDSMDGDSFSRREDSNLSMGDTKSDSVYDGSNIGVSSRLCQHLKVIIRWLHVHCKVYLKQHLGWL